MLQRMIQSLRSSETLSSWGDFESNEMKLLKEVQAVWL